MLFRALIVSLGYLSSSLQLSGRTREETLATQASYYAPKLLSFAIVFELKIIIFVLNYLTVLVFTKTVIHLSVCGFWWIFTLLLPRLATSTSVCHTVVSTV